MNKIPCKNLAGIEEYLEPHSSAMLKAVSLAYWRERADNPQGEARGILHELVMDCLRIVGVDFEDREDAARIAHEIAYKEPLWKASVAHSIFVNH